MSSSQKNKGDITKKRNGKSFFSFGLPSFLNLVIIFIRPSLGLENKNGQYRLCKSMIRHSSNPRGSQGSMPLV